MSAQILYKSLINAKVINSTGNAYFILNGIQTLIKDNSVFGNLIQEWLMDHMKINNIFFRINANTQEPPDFYLHPTDNDKELLEIKCFTKAPNFDIANFQSYVSSLLTEPYRLNSDYLIFEYDNAGGSVTIKNIWLKKVWEITSGSDRAAVNLQWKKDMVYNIRPRNWNAKSQYPLFASRLDFVKALESVVNTNAVNVQKNWFKNVSAAYQQQTGNPL